MLGTLLMLVFGVTWSWAVDYELLIEDPDIFSICTEGPPGSITVPEALNFDDLSINMDSDTIHVAGNATVRWEVEPTDRIVARMDLYHFNRGTWEPTLFAMSTQDFCAVMYDKNQYWYKYWTGFISNRRDVEKQCLSAGTVLVHDPFDLRLTLKNFRGPALHGRHKMVLTLQAFGDKNVPRPTSVCMEIRGEALKIK